MIRKQQTGFTLIEMAIVLVIIGLILGAVSVGKDLQRSAEYKKVKQKFVDQWAVAYNQYYDKMGVVVGDYQQKPTLVVNAQAAGGTAFTQPTSHDFTGATEPNRLCQGSSIDGTPGERAGASTNLHEYFDKAGIEMPPGRAEGREDRYVYLDSNGNPQEIQVCFQWNKPGTRSNSGNVMVITGLTPDMARHLDEMIDGKADAQEGVFRQQNVSDGTAGQAGIEWALTNREEFGASSGTTETNENLDEDQVAVVTAHYKMNQ